LVLQNLEKKNVYFPILIMAGTFGILVATSYALRWVSRHKKLRSPFTQNLLRGPGQSLLSKLDAGNEDVVVYTISAFFTPLVIYAVHISQSYFGGAKETLFRTLFSVGVALVLFSFSIINLIKLLRQRKNMRLGYAGELAVGQELDQMKHDGFYVYHDFPADNFNIDHIVVGPKGVFAVETKARSKPTSKNRVKDATVEYDGRMLFFPKGNDFKTIERAKRQADWLSTWLSKSIGEPIATRAIVALPGWFVKRTSSEGIPVVNPRQFSSLFEHIKPRALSESMITRISHQLEQNCRDVELKKRNSDLNGHS
jgi:hypothetical protein